MLILLGPWLNVTSRAKENYFPAQNLYTRRGRISQYFAHFTHIETHISYMMHIDIEESNDQNCDSCFDSNKSKNLKAHIRSEAKEKVTESVSL